MKLLSLASFGFLSAGACVVVGYYLLRKYRKSSDSEAASSIAEEKSASTKISDDSKPSEEAESAPEASHEQQQKQQQTTTDAEVLPKPTENQNHQLNSEIVCRSDVNEVEKKKNENEAGEREAKIGRSNSENKDIETENRSSDAATVTNEELRQRREEKTIDRPETKNIEEKDIKGVDAKTNGAAAAAAAVAETDLNQRSVIKTENTSKDAGILHDDIGQRLGRDEGGRGKASEVRSKETARQFVSSIPVFTVGVPLATKESDRKNDEAAKVKSSMKKEEPISGISNSNESRISIHTKGRESVQEDRTRPDGSEEENKKETSAYDRSWITDKTPSSSASSSSAAAASVDDKLTQQINSGTEPIADKGESTPIVKSAKSSLPLSALSPPPEGKRSKRQRERGVPMPASEEEARLSRRRWSPLEDTTLDKVEVNTDSQQALWKSSPEATHPGSSNPWSSIPETEATSLVTSERNVLFDDNFVETSPTNDDVKQSGLTGEKKNNQQSDTTPQCVLERKPLISEDDEDDDEEEEEVREEVVSREKVTRTEEASSADDQQRLNAAEEDIDQHKLIEIDQNCVGSLTKLTGSEVDKDVRLASLKALTNMSWTTEKHNEFTPIVGQLFANIDCNEPNLQLESLKVLVNLSKNPAMVPHLLAAKAPNCLLKLLVPEIDTEILINWLGVIDDILWTSKELCLTFASLPTEYRAASAETVYTGLYGLKNSRILKSRIFVLSRHKSQKVTYLASRIYSCLTS